MKKNAKAARRGRVEARRLIFETLERRRLLAVDAFSNVAPDDIFVETATENGAEAAETVWWSLANSAVDPSAEEQELLEQINRFRADPAGELDRIFSVANDNRLIARNPLVKSAISLYRYPKDSIETFLREWRSLSTTAPLAFNAALQLAAKSHNSKMILANRVSHQLQNEADLASRVAAAGFQASATPLSENVGGSMAPNGEYSLASYALAAFAVDWGVSSHSHRDALMNAESTEVGISLTATSKAIGPYATTCDFGTSVDGARTDGAYLLGVVYDDLDADAFYDVGEGLSDAKIVVERLDSADGTERTVEILSKNAGGYQIFLLNGSYRVTVESGAFARSITKSVSIVDGVNQKLDFRAAEAGSVAPTVDLNGFEEDGSGWNAVFVEGADAPTELLAASAISISDPDSPFLFGAKIYFQTRPDGSAETLDVFVDDARLRASFDDQGGFVELTGTGTLAEYEEAIASLSYFNASELCDLTDRTIAISVFDGVFWSDEAILTIAIKPTVLPNITVDEMVAYEGDEGARIATFAVELDAPARVDVSFNYRIVVGEGTAVEGEAFALPIGDPITIAKGETSAVVECYILGNFDALKPEGLLAVEGGFENPSTYFYIEIVDLENAYLTNKNALAKGTIYDDDSPIVLGTVSQYEFASALSTDAGRRRYIFSLTPETSGYFAWSAESFDSSNGLSISVRKDSLDSTPIALSEPTESGQKVQWFADPSVRYLVTVECAADFGAVAAKLLPISDENVVLVDPLLADAEEKLVELFWTDDGGFDLEIDDFSWGFDSEFAGGSEGGVLPTIKTDRNPDANLAFYLPETGGGSVGAPNGDETIWTSDSGGGTKITGFKGVTYWGRAALENLNFVGSNGDDYLYYANGSGYFSVGKTTYRFENVNAVTVDAGSGGNDVAFVKDSPLDDSLRTTNDSFGLYGGGFALLAKNFTDARILFVEGGSDSYYATDSGDDAVAVVAKTTSIIEGTFATIRENAETGETETVARPYRRVVAQSSTTTFSPEESIGSVSYFGDDSSETYFDVEVGALTAVDRAIGLKTVVYRAKNLAISGVPESSGDRFVVATPIGDYSVSEKDDRLFVVDAKGWSLSIPIWKTFAKTSFAAPVANAAKLRADEDDVETESDENAATRTVAFAEWGAVCDESWFPALESVDFFETFNAVSTDTENAEFPTFSQLSNFSKTIKFPTSTASIRRRGAK